MINFRKSNVVTEADAIVLFLRETFNQSIFTVEYLIWKHVENPAGQSFVLIAEENSKIIGLRIFMLWDFNIQGRTYKAIRPVDTAVHKDYQRKGLFTKLTLQGLEMMNGNYDFVFNTPNTNSLPGYLKMGWERVNCNVVHYVNSIISHSKMKNFSKVKKLTSSRPIANFINWRYKSSAYQRAIFGDGSLFIYRLEKFESHNVVILIDHFFTNENLKNYIESICSNERAIAYVFLFSDKTKTLKFSLSVKQNAPIILSKDAGGILDHYDFALGDIEGII